MRKPICVCVCFYFLHAAKGYRHARGLLLPGPRPEVGSREKFEERRPGLEKQKSSKNGIHPRTCRKACQRASLFLFHWLPELKKHTPKEKENLTCRKARKKPFCVCACVRSLEIFPQDVRKANFRKKNRQPQARIRGPESAKGFHGTRCTYGCGWAHEQAHARAWPRDARGWAFFDFSGQRGRNGEQTLDSMAAVQSGMHEKAKGSVHGAGQALSARARLGGAGSAKDGIGQDARPVQCGEADFECPLGRS